MAVMGAVSKKLDLSGRVLTYTVRIDVAQVTQRI